MASKPKDAPHSREERQAIATVAATREVYDQILKLADILKEDWRPVAQRVDAKHELVHASERLCNLMELALYQADNLPKGAVSAKLTGDLEELRGQLVGLGAKLVVEKLEKIDQRAEEVLSHSEFPIGLPGKLELAFHHLMSNLGVLGGAEKLGDKVPGLVEKTRTDLKSLNAIEEKLGVLVEVQPAKKRRR
jgi:hypothetical protein